MSTSAPRIAIASPGIGQVQRGFERLFSDLFEVVKGEMDVTLVKGGGPETTDEIVPAFLPRNGRVLRRLPVHRLLGRTPFHVECLSYALALAPRLRAGRFDLVHVIDPPLARVLARMRPKLGFRCRLLYTEGTNMPPEDYPPADHIHHISEPKYQASLAHGIPAEHMSLIPAGIRSERFQCPETRQELRQRLGVGPNTFVVLCVAALNRGHKRVHHLVEEFASLEGDSLLWLDGSMDHGDPDLPDWARQRLGDRCRITRVPSGSVGELYRLADVMVLPSLHEAFALVVPEALSCGCPVLAHDNPHFRWLVGSPANLLDMHAHGVLGAKLRELQHSPPERERLRRPSETIARFDWRNLRSQYLDLYRRVLAAPIRNDLAATSTPWQRLALS